MRRLPRQESRRLRGGVCGGSRRPAGRRSARARPFAGAAVRRRGRDRRGAGRRLHARRATPPRPRPRLPTRPHPAVSEASIDLQPASSSLDVPVDQPVVGHRHRRRLSSVTLTDDEGPRRSTARSPPTARPGPRPTRCGSPTTTASSRPPSTREGVGIERSGFFATLAPRKVLETCISPLGGQSVGVGMPIVVRFNAKIRDRAAVEKALVVTARSRPRAHGTGSATRRCTAGPRQFWPAYSNVKLDVDIKGVPRAAASGAWRTAP